MIITWTTDNLSDSRVDYGLDPSNLSSNLVNANLVTNHSLTINGLQSGSTYYFTVTSKDPSQNYLTIPDTPGIPLSFTMPDFTNPTISNIVVVPNNDGTASINWMTDASCDSKVDYGTDISNLSSNLTDVNVNTTHTLILTGLNSGTTYYFRVTSKNVDLNSVTSPALTENPISFTMTDFAPPIISNVIATPNTNSTAIITWTTDEKSDSKVDFGKLSTSLDSTRTDNERVTSHSITLTGLSSGTTYYFKLSSKDSSQNAAMAPSAPGSTISFTMPDFAPPVISNVKATPNSNGTAIITWTTDEKSDSKVDWGITNNNLNSNQVNTNLVVSHTLSLTGLNAGTTYYFRVTSKDSSQNATTSPDGQSNPLTFTVPDVTPPVISTIVSKANNNGTAIITWTTDEKSDSRIDYGNSSTSLGLNTIDANLVTSHSITLSGLSSSTLYYFRVSSKDSSLNSTTSPVASSSPLTFTMPDFAPPAISAIAAAPNSNGTAIITWTTDENSDSRVDYGSSVSALSINASDTSKVKTHKITLLGMSAGQMYYYRVTSRDVSLNSATSPDVSNTPMSFTIPIPVGVSTCAKDDSTNTFNSGTLGTNLLSVLDGNGALILKPAVSQDFTATSIPTGWKVTNWKAGGTNTYSGGAATVNGAHLYYNTALANGVSVEFNSKFAAENGQLIGLASGNQQNAPWVMIGRGNVGTGTGVYARTNTGYNILLSTSLLNSYHRYKINWNTSNFTIYVDGTLSATIPVTINSSMYFHASDSLSNTTSLSTDWVRISPYATNSTFTSRVIDAGSTTYWKYASWNSILPAGTSITISVRTGATATPDATWTPYQSVTNGGAIPGSSRYLQYQAVMTTSDIKSTPVLTDISFSCSSSASANRMTGSTMTDQTTMPQGNGHTAEKWSLEQNYPNPFNGSTIISYHVPKPTKVRFTIHDQFGRMVKLVEEQANTPGMHTLNLNLNGLAKGVYYYRMQAEGFHSTRKMILD